MVFDSGWDDGAIRRRVSRCRDRDAEGVEEERSGEAYPLPSRLVDLGDRRKLPQRGLGRSPNLNWIW